MFRQQRRVSRAEVFPEETKSGCEIHDFGLVRRDFHAHPPECAGSHLGSVLGYVPARATDREIVGVADVVHTLVREGFVEVREYEIRQHGRKRNTLRNPDDIAHAMDGRGSAGDQGADWRVERAIREQRQESFEGERSRNARETVVDVAAQHPRQAVLAQANHRLDSVADAQPRTVGERGRAEVRIDPRSDDAQDGALDNPIPDLGNVEQAQSARGLRDRDLMQRARCVATLVQFRRERVEAVLRVLREMGDGPADLIGVVVGPIKYFAPGVRQRIARQCAFDERGHRSSGGMRHSGRVWSGSPRPHFGQEEDLRQSPPW